MAFIIILAAVGLVLLLAEIFLFPGVGVAGILGVLALGGASYYAFFEFGPLVGAIFTTVFVTLLVAAIVYSLRAKTWKKLALKTNIDSKVQMFDESKLAVGDAGKTLTRLAPVGMARINDMNYEVKSLEGIISPGVDIEVVMLEDNKIYVKQITDDF